MYVVVLPHTVMEVVCYILYECNMYCYCKTMAMAPSLMSSRVMMPSRLVTTAISATRSIFTSVTSAADAAGKSAITTSLPSSKLNLQTSWQFFNRHRHGSPSLKSNYITQQQQLFLRCLSSMTTKRKNMQTRTIDGNNNDKDFGATSTLRPLLSQPDAENFAAYVHANRHQKVKPFILKRRRQQLKTYIGNEKNIRHSPWRMNLVCQFAHGLTVPEALKQLLFCQKVKAPLVAKVIRRTANLADIRDGIQPSQLEVAECFTTHGSHLKRLKIMGRGRSGTKHRRFSHIRLVLREIDFPTKLVQATSINQKRKWLERLAIAREDYEKARVEKDELAELEALAEEVAEKKRKEKEKSEE